ncbi:MAG: hypothetical protein RL748_237 [Pseudomonadota bacterium]|jgi:hypothetical protein
MEKFPLLSLQTLSTHEIALVTGAEGSGDTNGCDVRYIPPQLPPLPGACGRPPEP